jgi:DIS3-like exonuclease 2
LTLSFRLLDAALKGKKLESWSTQVLRGLTDQCNEKNLSAKRAGDSSSDLYLALFIKECGPIEVNGVIIEVHFRILDLTYRDGTSWPSFR